MKRLACADFSVGVPLGANLYLCRNKALNLLRLENPLANATSIIDKARIRQQLLCQKKFVGLCQLDRSDTDVRQQDASEMPIAYAEARRQIRNALIAQAACLDLFQSRHR